ncbi:MAG: hypothetical protein WKG32_18440, partial [Gemmatimonadaceae bacterium]
RVGPPAPRAGRVTGTVLGYRADTLLLLRNRPDAPGPDTVAVALGALRALDLRLGRQSRVRRAVGRGAMIGALVGAAGGVMAITTTVGMAAGALAGALVGSVPVERWQPVRHRQRAARLRIVPPTGRAGAGLAVALRL